MKNTKVLCCILVLLLLSGCSQSIKTSIPLPSPPDPSPVMTEPDASPHQTDATHPVETTALAPIPVITPDKITPAASPNPALPHSELPTICLETDPETVLPTSTYLGLPQAVLEFLNRGGTLTDLDDALYEMNAASQPLAVVGDDLTGNLKIDIIVSIYDSSSNSLPPGGKLLIYVCLNGSYKLEYSESSPQGAGAPGIRFVRDLDGDSKAEIITGTPSCGAHTCFEEVKVLGWTDGEFANRLVGQTQDLPFPVVEIDDPDGEGIYDIYITGGGFGSIGAGPQRSLTHYYGLDRDTGVWQLQAEIPGPSDYRIHILNDGDDAAEREEYGEALRLYQRVISDATLTDWMDHAIERENLTAYARLKIFFLYMVKGQDEFARVMYEKLAADHPAGTHLDILIKMADVFMDGWQQGGHKEGCRLVRKYAHENAQEMLASLGPQTFGYANPEVQPEDVCPW
jgi:hypothetical protein